MPDPTITITVDVQGLSAAKKDIRGLNVEVRKVEESEKRMGKSAEYSGL